MTEPILKRSGALWLLAIIFGGLAAYVGKVERLRRALAALEGDVASASKPGDNPFAHSGHIKDHLVPAMESLREAADDLEYHIAEDLWPLPGYREMLMIK